MAERGQQPIIIKRVKKGGHGHHGGAWKVAYADFVTAMMAFFLLLWLLNAVTEEQLQGIADYFAPTAVSKAASGAGGMLGGKVVGEEGAQEVRANRPSFNLTLPPPTIGSGGEDLTDPKEGLSEDQFVEAMAEREDQQFQKAKEALMQAVGSIPELAKLADSLLVDNTPEGLRIQIVDQDGLAMFPLGSANMYGHTRALLDLVSRVVTQTPQKIAISGHTDSIPFANSQNNYGNWELSAERALASRRALLMSGVPEGRIERVIGRADTEPLVVDDPKAPRNRRISIVLLRENQPAPKTEEGGASGAAPASRSPAGAAPPVVEMPKATSPAR